MLLVTGGHGVVPTTSARLNLLYTTLKRFEWLCFHGVSSVYCLIRLVGTKPVPTLPD